MAAPDPAYPRPQLVRERWTDLCGTWQFAYDDADTGLDERWYEEDASGPSGPFDREIVVPYPPESPASGIGETGFHPVVWYRRTFERPEGERILLHFGAVDYEASVWVNGTPRRHARGRPHPVLGRRHARPDERP